MPHPSCVVSCLCSLHFPCSICLCFTSKETTIALSSINAMPPTVTLTFVTLKVAQSGEIRVFVLFEELGDILCGIWASLFEVMLLRSPPRPVRLPKQFFC